MAEPILNQAEFVAECIQSYRHEPPIGYHWENAHFPKSRELGGTTTVRLWWPDHAIQNALQTIEYRYPCMYVGAYAKERAAIAETKPEYLEVYDEAYRFCMQYAGLQTLRDAKGIHGPEHQEAVAKGRRKGGCTVGALCKEKRKGIFDPKLQSPLARANTARKGGIATMQARKGIFALSPEQRQAAGIKGAAALNSQRWQSLHDGFQSTAAGVANHNRALGVPAEFKARVSN